MEDGASIEGENLRGASQQEAHSHDADMPPAPSRDPLRGLAKWMRFRGKPGTAAVLDAIAPHHDNLVSLERPADMRRNDLGGDLVHWLASRNLSIQLGLEKVFSEAPTEVKEHPIAKRHLEQNALDIPRLHSDLRTSITHPRSGDIVSARLSNAQIEAIQPLPLPPLQNLADLAAFDVVLSGANIGIAVQFGRQKRVLKLSGEPGGGAEFLANRDAAWKAGAKLLFGRAESEQLLVTDEAKTKACETGGQIIQSIIAGMKDPEL